jgi:hypothetical protein
MGSAGDVLFGLVEAPLDGALLNTRLHAWDRGPFVAFTSSSSPSPLPVDNRPLAERRAWRILDMNRQSLG